MVRIHLDKKILTIKGEPAKDIIPNPEYLKLSEKEKQKFKGEQTIEKERTIRDDLMIFLGNRFEILDKKEIFWTTELGIMIADTSNAAIEITDDKAAFLKRVVEKNKVKTLVPSSTHYQQQEEREIEVFTPFELGQILMAFETVEK